MVCPVSQPPAVSLRCSSEPKFAYAAFSTVAYGLRSYSPLLGRWVNRDPIGEDGGLNLLVFSGNEAIRQYDPKGLDWKIVRKSTDRFAYAQAQDSTDSFDDLATILDLDTSDYTVWAHTSDVRPDICKKYKIPNTMFVLIGLNARGIGSSFPTDIFNYWISKAETAKNDWESNGYFVDWFENASDSIITAALGTTYIYTFTFIGHGDDGIINSRPTGGVSPERYTKFGIAKLTANACKSAYFGGIASLYTYNMWEWNVATRGLFIGYTGEVNFFTRNSLRVSESGKNREGI